MTSASPWAIFPYLCLPWKQAVARGALIKNILLYLLTLSVLGISPLSCQSSLWILFLWILSIISLSCSFKHWSGLSTAHFSLRLHHPTTSITILSVYVLFLSDVLSNPSVMLVYSQLCVVWLHRLQPFFISLWLCSVVNWVYKVRYYYVINTFIVSVRFWPAVVDKCWRFSGKFECVGFLSERYWVEFIKQIFCDDHASWDISRKQNSAGAERESLPRLTHRALITVI